MRGLALVGVVLIFACGGASTGASSTRSTSTPKPSGSVAGTILPSSTATPTPRGDPLVGLLQTSTGNPFQNDTVMIVGLDGSVRAKASFKPRRLPDIGNFGPLLTPEARVTAGKVYYWDGDGVVHSIGVDGKIAEVARFPFNQPQQELSVAVSPDGSHVMAVLLTLPPPPPAPSPGQSANRAFNNAPYSIEVYSAAPGKTANKLSHQDGTITGIAPSQPVLQLNTWDAAGPVASFPAVLGTQGGSPHEWNGPLVQLDVNGTPITPIGGSDCPADDLTVDATYVCIDRTAQSKVIRVVATDGRRLWSHQAESGSYVYPFLAPNHSHAVVLGSSAVVVGADGSSVGLPAAFFHSGWLDDQIVVGSQGSSKDLVYVRLSQPAKAVGMGAGGVFVGGL